MSDGGAKAEETVLRVAEIGGRGRSLVAAQSLRAGQVVLRESPLLLYSAFPFLSSASSPYCDHCFRLLSQSARKCQSCSLVSFCSPNCLASHTPWLCESLRRIHQSSSAAFADQPSERQVQARYLLSAYSLAAASPSDFQILLSLQGNGDPTDSAAANFLHSLLSAVCPPLPVQVSPELTAALLAKDKVNGFGLMEPFSVSNEKRSVRAYGIYPKTSFFNHDCLPNAYENEVMEEMEDEEEQEEMKDSEGEEEEEESSFPHAYFFARYMCDKENCFGTLAPLPPKTHDASRVLECNVCGSLKEDEVV
ncbi:unnamed protein product, partial [Thlaspi arvense]